MNNEAATIRQAQQGSDEAFTDLVNAYQTHVYNLCRRMLGESEAAEDAAQETFLRAFQNLHRYDQRRSFATWLLSIAAHYCIDRLRRRRYSILSLDEDQDRATLELPDAEAQDPETETIQRELRDQIQGALSHLDSIDRATVVLRYWNDSSEAEIAEALGLTVSAVKSRLHRARRELAGYRNIEAARLNHERRPHESPAF